MKFLKLLIAALMVTPLLTACSDSDSLDKGPFTPATIGELSGNTWTAPYGTNGLTQIFAFSDINALPTVKSLNLLPTLLDEGDDEEGDEVEPEPLPEIEGEYLSNATADGFFTYSVVNAEGTVILSGLGLYKLQTEADDETVIDTNLTNTAAPVILQLNEEDVTVNESEELAQLAAQVKTTTLDRFADVDAQSIYWLTGESAAQQLRINPFGTFRVK